LPGGGTEGDPYLIEDLADFGRFAGDPNYWDDYTRLETDIDLDDGRSPYTSAVIAADMDNSDLDIEFEGAAFTGMFDGGGHSITNLTIDTGADGDPANDSDPYLGLFGLIGKAGEVRNLCVENATVTGGNGSWFLETI
jgi:hypothetical protein